jgi:predicted short-subunit dehydrogenase-like oxidoreductase (DUF2520 family)
MKVFIIGAGKVGRALAHALEKHGAHVTLHPARKVLPKKPIDASIIVLALRDKQLGPFAEELAAQKLVKKSAVVVHNAGSLDAEVLAPLRRVCAGIAQLHPMISFASTTFFPSIKHGHVHIKGDRAAETKGRKLAKKIGMTPRTFKKLDTVGYHAAAGLVANGAAALAAIGLELLVVSGVPRKDAPKMLGPLLRSVAENVDELAFPAALTGPVRRGDAAGIDKQIAVLKKKMPTAVALYIASGLAQLPIAAKIGDATKPQIAEVKRVLQAALKALK